jgi:hypothetical protein
VARATSDRGRLPSRPRDANSAVSSSISEADLLTATLGLAKHLGWRTAHFRPARTANGEYRTAVQGDGKGFPDCVLVRAERVVAAELKSARGRLAPEQQAWLEALARGGLEVYLWRPAHWANGEVERALSGKARC